MGKRQPPGTVLAVPLGSNSFGAARLLTHPLVEFSTDTFERESAIRGSRWDQVAFRIWVVDTAVDGTRWPVVGEQPLTEAEKAREERFFKKAPDGSLTVYSSGPVTAETSETAATLLDVEGLECAAVWSSEHVEDRLRDHRDGRPNKWVESMRPR